MNILFLLIPIALVFLAVAIGAFFWAVRTGQFEDMEGPAHRILMDDDDPRIPGHKTDRKKPAEMADKGQKNEISEENTPDRPQQP